MKTKSIIIGIILMGFSSVFAQDAYYNQGSKSKILNLSEMVGEWQGEGWAIDQESRTKQFFTINESVRYDLDSTILLVGGKGVSTEDQSIVHDAFGVISSNPQGDYFLTSWLGDGESGKFEMNQKSGDWVWTIPLPNGTIEYTIKLKGDEWHEVGVFQMNGQSYPFFEMKLKRVS